MEKNYIDATYNEFKSLFLKLVNNKEEMFDFYQSNFENLRDKFIKWINDNEIIILNDNDSKVYAKRFLKLTSRELLIAFNIAEDELEKRIKIIFLTKPHIKKLYSENKKYKKIINNLQRPLKTSVGMSFNSSTISKMYLGLFTILFPFAWPFAAGFGIYKINKSIKFKDLIKTEEFDIILNFYESAEIITYDTDCLDILYNEELEFPRIINEIDFTLEIYKSIIDKFSIYNKASNYKTLFLGVQYNAILRTFDNFDLNMNPIKNNSSMKYKYTIKEKQLIVEEIGNITYDLWNYTYSNLYKLYITNDCLFFTVLDKKGKESYNHKLLLFKKHFSNSLDIDRFIQAVEKFIPVINI